MNAYEEFETRTDLPCPSCGATWHGLAGTKGGREMTHRKDCDYIASLSVGADHS